MKIAVNGEAREVADGTSVAQLLRLLQVKPVGMAVEVNREVVPRRQYEETQLSDGDAVEVVGIIGGG